MLDLRNGDCLEVLKDLEPDSVDSIVTDPPYGISFMGRKWDYDVPSAEIWEQCLRVLKPGGHLLAFAGTRTQHRMAVNIEDAGFEIRDMIAWVYATGFPKSKACLKPALEPITMARKSAKRVQPLNIDGCRIGTTRRTPASLSTCKTKNAYGEYGGGAEKELDPNMGRWPANLIHDGSEEITELLNDAARFFYCPKASKADREDGNVHPTVKPTNLMAYLCRLVTPPGGIVLDPFMGSGSTGKAAIREGFGFIGIEREPDYYAIAQQRVSLKGDVQLGLIA